MAKRNFQPFAGDNAAVFSAAATAAAAALGACGWWAPERVAAEADTLRNIESCSNNRSALLALAALLDSAAEYNEGLAEDGIGKHGSIYSGDAGLAYAMLRKAERLLAQAESRPLDNLPGPKSYERPDDPGKGTATATAAAARETPPPATPSPAPAAAASEELSEADTAVAEAEQTLNSVLCLLSKEEDSHAAEARFALRRRFTFLQGQVGRLALQAVSLYLLNQEHEAFVVLRRLAAATAAALSRLKPEDCDLLYGRAGLLHALLFTRLLWLPPPPSSVTFLSGLLAREEEESEQQQQQQQQGQYNFFNDTDSEGGEGGRSSSSSRAGHTWEGLGSSSSSILLHEARAAGAVSRPSSTSSIAMGSSCSVQGEFSFDSPDFSRSFSSRSGKCCSRLDLISRSSQPLHTDRKATRVLVLSLISQLVGELAAQGRVGAVVSDCGSVWALDPGKKHMQPQSASAAFSRASPLPLVYEWHGKQYLGAAHGICGVLLQLLQAVDTLHQAALAGCFPGPASTPSRGSSVDSGALKVSHETRAAQLEEAEVAAQRLLTCSASVCNTMQKGKKAKDTTTKDTMEAIFFCASASAFLCCSDGVAAAAALRAAVRRLCLFSLLGLLRSHLTDTLNLKSSIGSSRDVLVQWCHGAPGLLPLLCWAVDLHREETILAKQHQQKLQSRSSSSQLQTQQQLQQQQELDRRKSFHAGDPEACAREDFAFLLKWLESLSSVVWQRGLLTKGLGICHGIAGNGLSLLCTYRSSRDIKWLRRALLFALEGVRRQQQLQPLPDRPLSLFEGVVGFSVFLRDCAELLRVRCNRIQAATFYYPGYELPPLPWEPWRL